MNYFSPKELGCRCCGLQPKQELLDLLNRIRSDYGKPIVVSSAKRCPKRNKQIGGAKNSAHIEGIACDFVRTEALLQFLLPRLKEYGLRMENPEKTPTWIHVDLRPCGAPDRIFNP